MSEHKLVPVEPSRESSMVVLERDEHGKPAVWCDPEIADLVSALNEAGIRTVASCSGHGHRPGNIMLADGRELVIARDFDEARKIDTMFAGIDGEPPMVDVEALVEALSIARDYVSSSLEEKKLALAGYPQMWRCEQDDLAMIDATLSAYRKEDNHDQ